MSIFNFDNYREFLQNHLASLPKKGRGEIAKMAKALGVHSTLMSLILSGQRELSNEQAYMLAQYLNLTDTETDFFCALVQLDRTSQHQYKKHLKKNLDKMRSEALKLSNRVIHDRKLSAEEQSIYYSSWIYSAIRLLSSTKEKGITINDIIERFKLDRKKVVAVLQALQNAQLVTEEKDHYLLGSQIVYLEKDSPHVVKHHSNWRLKALSKADRLDEQELMFTFPHSISKKDFLKVREQIADLLKSVSATVKESPAEDIACLNIDYFWIE